MGAFDRFLRILGQIQALEGIDQRVLASVLGTAPLGMFVRFLAFNLSLGKYAMRKKRKQVKEPPLLGHVWAMLGSEHFLLRHTIAELAIERIVPDKILMFELGAVLLHYWIELSVRCEAFVSQSEKTEFSHKLEHDRV